MVFQITFVFVYAFSRNVNWADDQDFLSEKKSIKKKKFFFKNLYSLCSHIDTFQCLCLTFFNVPRQIDASQLYEKTHSPFSPQSDASSAVHAQIPSPLF